jgi:hypothetical protein
MALCVINETYTLVFEPLYGGAQNILSCLPACLFALRVGLKYIRKKKTEDLPT